MGCLPQRTKVLDIPVCALDWIHPDPNDGFLHGAWGHVFGGGKASGELGVALALEGVGGTWRVMWGVWSVGGGTWNVVEDTWDVVGVTRVVVGAGGGVFRTGVQSVDLYASDMSYTDLRYWRVLATASLRS